MILYKMHIYQSFNIKAPIWGGRKVGLATHKIDTHNEVNILKTDASGQRIYPHPFYISGVKARTYPIQPVPSNPHIKLYIIPIEDMEILEHEQ